MLRSSTSRLWKQHFMSDPPAEECNNCPGPPCDNQPLLSLKQFFLHHQQLFVVSVGKKDQQQSEQWQARAPTPSTCRTTKPDVKLCLLCVSAILYRFHLKLHFFPHVAAFVESCWVSPPERDQDCGSARWNVAPHCSQSWICCLLMVSLLSSFMPLEPACSLNYLTPTAAANRYPHVKKHITIDMLLSLNFEQTRWDYVTDRLFFNDCWSKHTKTVQCSIIFLV